jgi:hypothetical protein
MDRIDTILKAELPTVLSRHYAGEFFNEETVKRIATEIGDFPTILYDIESITNMVARGDTTGKGNTDEITVVLYCARSLCTDEGIQWRTSYELASQARAVLVGEQVVADAVNLAHGNGHFRFADILREFHIAELSVHTLRLIVRIPVNSQLINNVP